MFDVQREVKKLVFGVLTVGGILERAVQRGDSCQPSVPLNIHLRVGLAEPLGEITY